MRNQVDELLESFQRTLDDQHFSGNEKQALRLLLEEAILNEEEKAYLRNRLFALARAHIQGPQSLKVLDWLDLATKTLFKPGPAPIHETYFSPIDDCVNVIIHYLRRARRSLKLCVFTITDDRISHQIVQCHKEGINIKVISDNEKAFDLGSDIQALAEAGIEVRIDNTPNHMHHKYAIIDDQIVITGSYNWTRSAAHHNHENILISNENAFVVRYRDSFHDLWDTMEPFPTK